MKIEANINEYVECELTDRGMHNIRSRGFNPEIIKGNRIKIQIWELMNNLGDSVFNGADQQIVDNKITFNPQ
jgi:hypothetical protein